MKGIYNILKYIQMNHMAHTGNAEKIQNMFGISYEKEVKAREQAVGWRI